MQPEALRTVAERVFVRARDKAREAINQRKLTESEANAKLRPWAAAAAAAGARLTQLEELERQLPFASPWLLSQAVMDRTEWVPVLVAARDTAMARHGNGDGSRAEIDATLDLMHLCGGLRLAGIPAIPHYGDDRRAA